MSARPPNPVRSRSVTAAENRSFLARRTFGIPAWVFMVQLFFGFGWLRAAAEKIVDPSWWDGSSLAVFIGFQTDAALSWYQPILDHWIAPNPTWILFGVVLLQLVAAATLISGRFYGYGLAIGMFLNLNFLAAGVVNPSVFYLLGQGAVALWLAEVAATNRHVPRFLTGVALFGYALAMVSLPDIWTIHPADVIQDPAVMLIFVATITFMGCDLAHRRVTFGKPLPVIQWLRGGKASKEEVFAPD